MTPAESGSVTITQQASRQSKNASIAQMTTVDTIPAMSCGSVDESMDSCAVTSPMMRSATSVVSRRLKKLMGSFLRWSARRRRVPSDSVYAAT